jgi:hypothetical protein|tara:strand:- start:222 stop:806 length:585 start_codon:yes stop_codon:yes gene_type:complete
MSRNDIQTEMIMNSDSSNVVSEILNELNNSNSSPQQPSFSPQMMPTQMPTQIPRASQVQPSLSLNEGSIINQYDNKDISNEAQINRQLDPYMNINPDVRLDLKNKVNMSSIDVNRYSNNFLAKPMILRTIHVIKNVCILFVLLLIVLSPLISNILVKYMSKLYGTGASQLFKWIGLILKALFISIVYNVIHLFI